ncbi:MAG TPA: TfuA-like protein [Kofleriaceae bacterium]|nr:TfuA-like protein [Kofleriaceae bacterium]
MTTLVYIGPTLPADEVRARLPSATVLPPVAVGDILKASRQRGVKRIAIVDGYFERMAAVWHKEILVALERGIAVYGAASMGALRAAELAPWGMIGVGSIYRDYARGVLVADDEVAVAHLPAEYGYRAVSDALVNIRYGLRAAAKAKVIPPALVEGLVDLARLRFYRERTWTQLVTDAGAAGMRVDSLTAWPKPDRKRKDARLLLRRLGTDRMVRPARIRVPRTWALRQLESLML